MTTTVNELSSSWLSVSFFDRLGAAAAPSSITCRIDCTTTGTAIRASTAVTPAATVEIAITPTENRIINTANATERRRVTVIAVYGGADQLTEQIDYDVRNLAPGVT